jgi:hypothetical protein
MLVKVLPNPLMDLKLGMRTDNGNCAGFMCKINVNSRELAFFQKWRNLSKLLLNKDMDTNKTSITAS